jgi:hypothetical protein
MAGRVAGSRENQALRLLTALVLVAAVACSRDGPRRVLAQRALLKRQIEDLSSLVQAAEKGALLPRDKLVVAVSERMVTRVIQLALPREQVVAERYRVRLERVDVQLRDRHGTVRFDGRVSSTEGSPQEFTAELAVFGLVEAVEADQASGVLRARLSVVGFELQRFGLQGETETGRRMVEELARLGAEAFQPLALPVAIPVRLEQELALPGAGGNGPVRFPAASVPLRLTVADVAAHGGRLWMALDVAAGPWRKGPPSPTPAASPGVPAGGGR